MAYDVNTITTKGAELLAAATAADKLILDGCDATTTYLDAATAALVENRPASPLSNTTDVSIIMYTSNNVQARASFLAGTNTGGDANTLYLYGHKQSAPSDIYVIYVASSQDPFHLPEVGDVANSYETLFNMQYTVNANAVTTPSTSTFCTLAEFNILRARTVTTHKEGETTIGDNQTIYGDKYFRGDVECQNLGANSLGVNNIDIAGNIYVQETDPDDDPGDIGKSTRPFGNIYTTALSTDSIANTVGSSIEIADPIAARDDIYLWSSIIPHEDATISSNIGSNLGSQTYNFKTLFVKEIDNGVNDTLYLRTQVLCDQTIMPNAGVTTAYCGTYGSPWIGMYGGGLRIFNGAIGTCHSASDIISFDSRIYFGSDSMNLQPGGTTGLVLESATSHGFFNFTAESTDLLKIEYKTLKSSYQISFGAPVIFKSGNPGFQPTYDSDTSTRNIAVGSIIMAWCAANTVGYVGQTRHITSMSGWSFAKSDNGTIGSASVDLPSGYYALLCDFDNSSHNTWVLLQCLSLD